MSPTVFTSGPLAGTAFQRNGEGLLCCDGQSLTEIATTFGTPVYVYSERTLIDAYQQFRRAAQNENALICYALKANSNLAIIRLLATEGAGFDIV